MRTLAAESAHEQVIKRSRFLAVASRADSPEAALVWLGRNAASDASHNCWAYRVGNEYRFSDDGEPGGTAGRPILAAIEGAGLDHVIVVVTRWYGGVKLGAGGLVRAYGGTAAACLAEAHTVVIAPTVDLVVTAGFAHSDLVHGLVERFDGRIESERYDAEGVRLDVRLAADVELAFVDALRDQSRGQAVAERFERE